jgi:hypothetical protein
MKKHDDNILVPCPIATSSDDGIYNDMCKATGKPCPYYADEGMSVCKNKLKCLKYFSKNEDVNMKTVFKLIFSNMNKLKKEYIKKEYIQKEYIQREGISHHESTRYEEHNAGESTDKFVEELEAAIRYSLCENEINSKNNITFEKIDEANMNISYNDIVVLLDEIYFEIINNDSLKKCTTITDAINCTAKAFKQSLLEKLT